MHQSALVARGSFDWPASPTTTSKKAETSDGKKEITRWRGSLVVGDGVAKGRAREIKGERRRCAYVCLIAIEYSVWRGHTPASGGERAPLGRRVKKNGWKVRASCGPICNFLPGASLFASPRAVPSPPLRSTFLTPPPPTSSPARHHASRHPCIKCCSPYKISPRRGRALMNYRVRPSDRSNYIERGGLLTAPRDDQRERERGRLS